MSSLQHSPHQAQKQQFSARLQKAVRLLQMPSTEFVANIQASVADNPFLDGDDLSAAAAGNGQDEHAGHDGAPPAEAHEREHEAADASVWGIQVGERRAPRSSSGDVDALAFVAATTSLHDHLHAQLRMLRLADREFLLASVVCESIDDDGYLRDPLDEIALLDELDPAPTPAELEQALAQVQSLDPPGVGARSASECLRLQLAAVACPEDRALCQRLLSEWSATPRLRDPAHMAHRLGCSAATVGRLLQHLRGLDPHPGWRHGTDDTRYVVPDVIARKTRQGWTAQLNEAVMPRVRINQAYADLHRQCHEPAGSALSGQLTEARWTVRNIERRFSTILAVAQAIVQHQQRFLDHGALAMRPLVLRQIAEELGMHESTVSRVTHQKYIATPSGTFELGSFFSRGMEVRDGGTCSPTAVRSLVQEIIAGENGQPLSDVAIAQRLERQGIKVARRTVTKYRQQLGLRAADQRRAPR